MPKIKMTMQSQRCMEMKPETGEMQLLAKEHQTLWANLKEVRKGMG
jgi:hypothetical protein